MHIKKVENKKRMNKIKNKDLLGSVKEVRTLIREIQKIKGN